MIGGDGFAFIPNRFLREGFLASLEPDELRLFLLLVLAGDRKGLSFYHYDSICSILELPLDDYLAARDGLIDRELIAYDGRRFQVLTLPAAPRSRPASTADVLPADPHALAIRAQLRAALDCHA
jgi:hypothetical protein